MNTTPAEIDATETDTETVEPRPLRSMEDLLDERLDQRETADIEEAEAEDEIGETRNDGHQEASATGRYTEEGSEVNNEGTPDHQSADDEELPSGPDRRSSAFREEA